MRKPGFTPCEVAFDLYSANIQGPLVQDILLARARSLDVEIPANELDTAYANARNNLSDDAFQQELTKRRLTAADMREGLRRQLLAQKVIEQEIGSKLVVTEREMNDFFTANRAQFNLAEESYHLAHIVVTPVHQVTWRTGRATMRRSRRRPRRR